MHLMFLFFVKYLSLLSRLSAHCFIFLVGQVYHVKQSRKNDRIFLHPPRTPDGVFGGYYRAAIGRAITFLLVLPGWRFFIESLKFQASCW